MFKIGAGVIATIIVIILVVGGLFCTTTVPAGYVAVQYNMQGGIMDDVLTQGFHIVSPFIKTTKYAIALNQSYLTADKRGDSEDDESFSSSSAEGKSVQIELTYTYQYEADNVVDVFNRFKGQDGIDIRDSFIKPNIISWAKEIIAQYKVTELLGPERAMINIALSDYLTSKFEPYGITVSNVSLIDISVDAETMNAINEKITAQQYAETQAINNQTAIDKATADATVATTTAQAEADALLIVANAQAEANKILSDSITDNVLKTNWIDRWDGVLPEFITGETSAPSLMIGVDD